MKGDGDLNKALQKFLVLSRCISPDVFESFVSVEKLGVVKQANSVLVLVKVHASFLHAVAPTHRRG
jgi:hypothetical protein